MKSLWFLTFLLAILLTSCVPSASNQTTPVVMTVEVTKIIQITTTPIDYLTATPTSTLEPKYARATSSAEMIGTPITVNEDCYETAMTQQEMNGCAGSIEDSLEKEMAKILQALQERYKLGPKEDWEKFMTFQTKWEDLSKQECTFLAGYTIEDGHYKGGSIAPVSYYGCLSQKYENRLRELQGQLYTPD